MKSSFKSRRGASNAAVLGGFAIVGVAILIGVILLRQSPPPRNAGTGDPGAKSDSSQTTPTQVKQSRKRLGRKSEYEVHMKVSGRATNQDWGAQEDHFYEYLTTAKFTSEVKEGENDRVRLESRKYDYAGEKLIVTDFHLELSKGWYSALVAVDPSGTTAFVVEGARIGANMAGKTTKHEEGKAYSVTGKAYNIRYESGKDPQVTREDGTTPTKEELDVVLSFPLSVDQGFEGKDSITVEGQDIAGLFFDPSLGAMTTGSFTATKRGSGDKRDTWQFAGSAELVHRTDKNETCGEMRLGDVSLIVNEGLLEEGHATGKIKYSIRSTDHLLFEARQSTEPDIVAGLTAKVIR